VIKGPQFEVDLPERLNLGSYYLDVNLAAGRGDKTAICCANERYSFAQLWRLTNKLGNVLRQLGVEPENRVLLVLEDSPEWIAAWLAIMKIGAVGAHAYTYLHPKEYAYLLDLVRPKVVVADGSTLGRLREGCRGLGVPPTLLVAGGDAVSGLAQGELDLRAMLEHAGEDLEVAATHRDDPAFWNFSSGSTGEPKGVPHMHRDGVVAYEAFNYDLGYDADDVVVRVPKLFFHYSRDLGALFPLRSGAAVVLSRERATPAGIFRMIEEHRPTVLINVPTMMRAMLETPQQERADLACVRRCMSSGELLSAQLAKAWTDTFGGEIVNRYGSAESGAGLLYNRSSAGRLGSSGTVTALATVKLVDDHGVEVPRGQPGILLGRTDASGLCYVREHAKSKATFLGNEWVNTGDLFVQDADDYFWYAGRANEVVKVRGVWVSPAEIEQCLQGCPEVKECVVLALEDGDGLMQLRAFVALKEGVAASPQLAGTFQQVCKDKLAPHKYPRAIEFMNELPKTGPGKFDRRRLRQWAQCPPR